MDDVVCGNVDLIKEKISRCERSSQSLGDFENLVKGRNLWPIVCPSSAVAAHVLGVRNAPACEGSVFARRYTVAIQEI